MGPPGDGGRPDAVGQQRGVAFGRSKSGGPVGDPKQTPRTAKNTIYFDATHPTAIVLPVVKQ